MKAGETSSRNGIEDFLCPFTRLYITQGSGMNGGTYSHNGTMANDVNNGAGDGTRSPYYAPCTCKCINIIPSNGESRWQSLNKVRFANGRIDYATFEICHDNSFNAKVGMVVQQGVQLGNMGNKGGATGVHCHIQISQSKQNAIHKNKYGIWCFDNEYDTDDCYFMDNTEILNMKSANWRYINDVPVAEEKKDIEAGKTYKLLIAKCIRRTPNLGNNIVKVKEVDATTKKSLTSTNKNANAMLKIGFKITPIRIVNENGRIWGSYGNCFVCLKNADGTMQCELVKE